ncbi:hypothetical protein E3N88_14069 [Mikania micrantha]|uniref:Neprosin PEP catalytic domain-containing protein n=1 Tax=Mikania micrantha TaxID=192012 RepID=A0A5N6P0F3_9ASTR|nr:hypothetical protein E3N88_14069 [Mikania micrantha]
MTKAKLSFLHFVVVLMVAQICHGSRSRFPSSIKVHKHLNLLNKAPVKSIESPDGDTIDCVHIAHQPAFDHPILKNHTIIKVCMFFFLPLHVFVCINYNLKYNNKLIQMRPSYYPDWIKDENINTNASKDTSLTSPPKKHKSITQLWHSNGKCPKGTIPIRRTKKEDMLRASSLKSYGRKNGVARRSSIDSELASVNNGHEYAFAGTDGVFYGTKATFNLWNPKVQVPDEFSLGQLWITRGSDSDLNTIEAGWQVYPGLYGDSNTRIFIYWTSDGYHTTGCYNLGCTGFVQTNNDIALGGTLSPTSQVDGSQYEMTILIWKDPNEGDWWMQLGDDELIGYWPASLFTCLSESASTVEWGGEVVNLNTNGHHTTTDMGSGYFPQKGAGKACYIRNIQIVDESNTLRTPEGLYTDHPEQNCYDIVVGMNDNSGSQFFFGGPGRNQNCP